MSVPSDINRQQRLCTHPLHKQEIWPVENRAVCVCTNCGKILETHATKPE